MINKKVDDLLELKVLLSEKVSIYFRDNYYPITKVKLEGYNIQLIAETEEPNYLNGRDMMTKVIDIISNFNSFYRFENIELVIIQGTVAFYSKPYNNKEVLTIKPNHSDLRLYNTILYN